MMLTNRFLEFLKHQKIMHETLENQQVFTACISFLQQIENEQKLIFDQLENLKKILDISPCTISWVGRDLTYSWVNRALANACSLRPEEFVGKEIGFYTQNKFLSEFILELFQASEQSMYRELATKINDENRFFWVSGTKFDENQQAVIIGIDTTELKQLENYVSFSEKLSELGEMMASIIHEVNNPLAAIHLKVQKIQRKLRPGGSPASNEEILKTCEEIFLLEDKVQQIIRGIKSFARKGHNDPYKSHCLETLLQEALAICSGKLKDNEVAVEVELLARHDFMVEANATHLFQVFINLINNAVDAMVEAKLESRWLKITIDHSENSGVTMQFIDAGNGIPQAIVAQIFEAFFTTKAPGVGTGLGLSLCQKIMHAHGGQILYKEINGHTCFELQFMPAQKSLKQVG